MPMPPAALEERIVLSSDEWASRMQTHERRVDGLVRPHLERRRHGEKHPVEDFLFTYYSHRPAQLRRWHPGAGMAARPATPTRTRAGPATSGRTTASRSTVVACTAGATTCGCRDVLPRPPLAPASLGCFGLHEWAMVYRTARHPARACPLRLGAEGTDAVVEATRSAAPTSTRSASSPTPRRPLNVAADARGPGRPRAARLPPRDHGPLQVGLQARAADPERAVARLLRARPRHPRAGHARRAVRPARLGVRAGAHRDRRGQGGVRQRRSAPSPQRGQALRDRLLAASSRRSAHVARRHGVRLRCARPCVPAHPTSASRICDVVPAPERRFRRRLPGGRPMEAHWQFCHDGWPARLPNRSDAADTPVAISGDCTTSMRGPSPVLQRDWARPPDRQARRARRRPDAGKPGRLASSAMPQSVLTGYRPQLVRRVLGLDPLPRVERVVVVAARARRARGGLPRSGLRHHASCASERSPADVTAKSALHRLSRGRRRSAARGTPRARSPPPRARSPSAG